jgi:hypothetical protein
MKIIKIIGLIFGIFQLALNSFGQIVTPPPKSGAPIPIETSNINIKNPVNSNKIFYGESAEVLMYAFGTPTSSEPFLFEMENKIGTLYKFGLNRLLFLENKLFLFTIKSNDIYVGNGNIYIKVGDPISVISAFYPNYILEDNVVWTDLKFGSALIDGSLKIKTNGTIITEIVFFLD